MLHRVTGLIGHMHGTTCVSYQLTAELNCFSVNMANLCMVINIDFLDNNRDFRGAPVSACSTSDQQSTGISFLFAE